MKNEITDFNQIRITGSSYDKVSYKAGENCESAFGSIASRKETGTVNFFKFVAFESTARKINELNIQPDDRISITGSLEYKRYKAADGSAKGTYRIVVSDIEKL